MKKAIFQAYERPFPLDAYGVNSNIAAKAQLSHTFVVCDDDRRYNWNCWGDGEEAVDQSDVKPLGNYKGEGYAAWVSLLYGSKEGERNPTDKVMGLRIRVDGVCQNASNRILALSGRDMSVSEAPANAAVLLMYGKFGFGIESFIQDVRSAAEQINQKENSSILAEEIEAVIATLCAGADDEMGIIGGECLGTHFHSVIANNVLPEKLATLKGIYKTFQIRRAEIYNNNSKVGLDGVVFQKEFAKQLSVAFINCLVEMKGILSPDEYKDLFPDEPETLASLLLPSIT